MAAHILTGTRQILADIEANRLDRNTLELERQPPPPPQQLSPTLAAFAYDIVHHDNIHLDFGGGSDAPQRVWFDWTDPGFFVTVETWYYRGTISASHLYPSEDQWHYDETHYTLPRMKAVVDTLAQKHSINLLEALE
jgi:hypothetical protein